MIARLLLVGQFDDLERHRSYGQATPPDHHSGKLAWCM